MNKSKLLALTLSAISTGILISCAKPTENTDSAEAETTSTQESTQNNANTTASTASMAEATDSLAENNEAQALDIASEQASAYLSHVASDYIIPTYQQSVKASQQLQTQAEQLCKSGHVEKDDLQTLRDEWLRVAIAWAKAEVIDFGPATENMSNLYINYFPDERGLVHKSVTALIKDSPNVTPEEFVDQSAIVQGVPALEDLLFTNDSLNEAQCAYLVSASTELTRRLSTIAEDWQNNSNELLDTEDTTKGFNQWYNSLLAYIENLKSVGIDKPFGLTANAKGHVPAHKSGQSRAIVQAKVDMLAEMLQDKQLTALLADKADVIIEMENSLTQIKSQLAELPADISKAEKGKQQALYDNLTVTTKQIKRQLMPLLGVQVGFNSTDGD